jgi:Asp-tRNA(Asn)/Glu-tRNA(Gln) amidotransferase A subunit family amidase
MDARIFAELDGVAIAEVVRSRQCSAVEVAKAAFERITACDDVLGAFTVKLVEAALDRAQELDDAVARGEDPGPLTGVPVSIKDELWVRGALATNGSLALRDFVPKCDTVPVARIRRAGATIVGKTNNPEFCARSYTDNALWGVTRNPWNLERTPGGSSGGAGASVAAGMTPIAVGSDAGGSLRIPAAYCGLVGVKPTFGLLPKEPGFQGWKTLAVVGPLTRTVRDAAVALEVMSGEHPADDMSYLGGDRDFVGAAVAGARDGLSGLRVAYSVDRGVAPVDPDIRRVFAAAVKRFAEAGATVVEAYPDADDPVELWNRVGPPECFAANGPLVAQHEDELTAGTADYVRAGDVPAHRYIEGMFARAEYTTTWRKFFDEYDLLLTPTVQTTAFRLGIDRPVEIDGRPLAASEWERPLVPANLTGHPAVTVPCGTGDDGLPIGLQITASRFEDALALRAGAAWETLAPWPRLAPDLEPGHVPTQSVDRVRS